MRMSTIWGPLAKAIAATGTDRHVDCLIDLIGADIDHDLVTVTRYSATQTPEFIKHRRFSDEMVRRYLDNYYVFDPFYASWRRERRLGILPLKRLADEEAKRGQYIAGFLAQSEISDEVGIMLADGGDWCLGIFSTARPLRSGTARSPCWMSGCQCSKPCMRSTSRRAAPSSPVPRRRPAPAPRLGRSRPSRRACGRNFAART